MAAADKPRSSKVVEGDYHEPEFIHIVVSDAQRVGDYITYKITTSVSHYLWIPYSKLLILYKDNIPRI